MPSPSPIVLRNYGHGHLALVGEARPRIDLDPHLPGDPDDRDAALKALRTDFVLRTGLGRMDDTLDVLEEGDAVLVSSPDDCRHADRELELEDRLVDVQGWDRVRFGGLTLTCVPAPRGSLPGAELLPDADRVLGTATDTLGRALGAIPVIGELAGRTGSLGGMGSAHKSRRALALHLDDGPTLLLAGDTLTGAAARSWLEDIAETVDVDVLVAAAGGDRVDGLVWAVRELKPSRVVLFRDHDPYDNGGRSLPIARFVEALAEDAPDLQVQFLREGEELQLGGT